MFQNQLPGVSCIDVHRSQVVACVGHKEVLVQVGLHVTAPQESHAQINWTQPGQQGRQRLLCQHSVCSAWKASAGGQAYLFSQPQWPHPIWNTLAGHAKAYVVHHDATLMSCVARVNAGIACILQHLAAV